MSHGNRSESTFAHYLNQCWFLLCEVLWHLNECPGYNHVQWVWKSYFKNYSLISKTFEPYAFFMKSFTFSFELYGMISWGSNIRPNSHIPQCTVPHSTFQNRNVHISVLDGALWDVGQVHCGICEICLLTTMTFWQLMITTRATCPIDSYEPHECVMNDVNTMKQTKHNLTCPI